MRTFLMPLALLLLLLLAWLGLRARPRSWRIAGAAFTFGLLSLALWNAGVSPLLIGSGVPSGAEGHWLRCVGILWWVIAARLAALGVRRVLERDALSREARITADLLSGLIYLTTVLVVLDFVLLLPVGGLVATSGVVAVVIGLALQNTLADVFSGIAVGIERPFGAGDRITLADGIEGVVIEINWRSIRVQTDGDDIATVPNSVIAKAQILNRSVPTKRRSVHVVVTCPTGARPELVLELLRRAAMLCSHILLAPAPTASMIRLGVRTATFAIDYYVADTAMIGKSRTALLTQTHRQLRYAGIIHDADGAARTDDAKCAAVVDELPIFARLSAEHRATIAKHLKRITIHNGDVVFAKGEEADRLIMIAAGVIDVSGGGADAQSDRLGRAGPGEAIGDIGLIAGEARPYTARAASDGILYTLDRDDLLSLIQENQTFAAELERSASEHFDLLQAPADERAIPVGHTPFFLKALRRHLRPARHPEQP